MLETPKSRADDLLMNFVLDCRRQPRMDTVRMMLGPAKLDVRTVFPDEDSAATTSFTQHLDNNMPSRHANTNGPLGNLIGALIANAGIVTPLERLGMLSPLQSYIAWLAHPSRETQARVPAHLIPRHSQLDVPHPPWVGLVQWGRLRCAIIHRQDVYGTDEFLRFYSTSIRLVNWPTDGAVEDAIESDPTTGHVWLTDRFIAHAVQFENWRLDVAFARRYPELANLVDLIDLSA